MGFFARILRLGSTRHELNVPARMKLPDGRELAGETLTISRHGAFIVCDPPPPRETIVDLRLLLREGREIRCAARVSDVPAKRVHGHIGVEVVFRAILREDKHALLGFVGSGRRHKRYRRELKITLVRDAMRFETETIDVSASGCKLNPGTFAVTDGQLVAVELELPGSIIRCLGKTVRSGQSGELMGIEFRAMHRADNALLREHLAAG